MISESEENHTVLTALFEDWYEVGEEVARKELGKVENDLSDHLQRSISSISKRNIASSVEFVPGEKREYPPHLEIQVDTTKSRRLSEEDIRTIIDYFFLTYEDQIFNSWGIRILEGTLKD